MMLLKGTTVYKEFQSNATVALKPGCRAESLGELFGNRGQSSFQNVDSWSSLISSIKSPGGGAGKSVLLKNPVVTQL